MAKHFLKQHIASAQHQRCLAQQADAEAICQTETDKAHRRAIAVAFTSMTRRTARCCTSTGMSFALGHPCPICQHLGPTSTTWRLQLAGGMSDPRSASRQFPCETQRLRGAFATSACSWEMATASYALRSASASNCSWQRSFQPVFLQEIVGQRDGAVHNFEDIAMQCHA